MCMVAWGVVFVSEFNFFLQQKLVIIVFRNHPQAFSSLGICYFLFISLYPFVASLLDVVNGVCFLEHTMVSHRIMVPM